MKTLMKTINKINVVMSNLGSAAGSAIRN